MNKLLSFLAIILLFNCSQKPENKDIDNQASLESEHVKTSLNSDRLVIDNENPENKNLGKIGKIEDAKSIIDETNDLVKKGILKQMNSSEVNEKINPLMMKYDSLISNLSRKEMKELEIYRTQELNKTIKLQVENR